MLIGPAVKECWNVRRKIIAWCWYMGSPSIQILMFFFSDLHLIYNEIETCLFHALQLQTILNAPLDSQSIICCFFYFFRVFQLLPFSYHKKRELVFRHFRTIIHLGIHCDPIRDLAKTLQDTGLGAHSMRRFTEKWWWDRDRDCCCFSTFNIFILAYHLQLSILFSLKCLSIYFFGK